MDRNLLFIPGPVTVAQPVLAAMARPMIDHRSAQFAQLLERLEAGLQPIFGTAGDVEILGSSGTGGLEAAVASSFSPGERVLACPIGVFGKRLINIANTSGLDVDVLETPLGSCVDTAALAERIRTDGAHRYAGILLTHNETSTGSQNDMAAVSAALGDHPALRIVDSVSGLAASEFRMDEWGYDIVVTASQKALAVPPGLAMVAISPKAWERIERAKAPSFYFDLKKAREFEKLGQTPWTPPVSIVYALDVALERYAREGPANVWARHERYARAIRAGVEAIGLEVFSQPGAHSVTVVAIKLPEGLRADEVRRSMREDCGVVIGGGQQELKGKIVRIGTMGALAQTDILGALGALEIVLLQLGHHLQIGAGVKAALEVFLDREPAIAR